MNTDLSFSAFDTGTILIFEDKCYLPEEWHYVSDFTQDKDEKSTKTTAKAYEQKPDRHSKVKTLKDGCMAFMLLLFSNI